ncbi:DUF445 domain-containing protein [Roseococcus sp. SYP-B2431]|uniref:DUF445 domain-containing protein n=1 Tax=Roseococcus sp. SYP-B2431 TaxID=2496640 RepID=UPI001F0E224E|nr:DUF445 domain-containing protein [Roseococcus sp. SYP-B2431]
MPNPDDALRSALARHRAIATFLLVVMAGLTLLAYRLPPNFWTDLLAASAKAGVVGGLADWFAVTALFRRPLGLPIPHTAIIPRQKERLGQGLGRFVANHVFTEAELRRVIARLDIASILAGFLADPKTSRPAAQALAAAVPRLLRTLEDGRALRLTGRLLPRLAGGPAAALVVARALRALMAGGQHQAVFDLALAQLKIVLAAKQEELRDAIKRRVREQGGKLMGWAAGAYVADKVLAVLNAELEKVEPGESDLRLAFEAWIEAEIARLENEPERAAAMGRAIRSALSHPAVAEWLGDIWARLREAVVADAANPEGRTIALIGAALVNTGTFLAEDEAARARLNGAVEGAFATLVPSAQSRLAEFIAGVVKGWDTAEVTEKIELRVGKDLQYVRINGTVVGFLAGGALYLLIFWLAEGRVVH